MILNNTLTTTGGGSDNIPEWKYISVSTLNSNENIPVVQVAFSPISGDFKFPLPRTSGFEIGDTLLFLSQNSGNGEFISNILLYYKTINNAIYFFDSNDSEYILIGTMVDNELTINLEYYPYNTVYCWIKTTSLPVSTDFYD